MFVPFYSFFLNLIFDCSKNILSFSFDKVTAGAYNSVSVILKFNPVGATIVGLSLSASLSVISTKTQLLDQVKMNSTSQLISGIFKLLQKLLKYFRGITTFAFINESLSCRFFSCILALYLKDSELEERRLNGSSL